jgi:hypothetical protein
MNTLFCIGTFQAIANLPPLLAVAEAGDQVVFLDSSKVDSQKIIPLLPKNLQAKAIKISDDLPKIIEEVRNFLSTIPEQQKIYLIFNGGTKLSSLAVLEALRERQPSIIYGQEQPCEYWQCDTKLTTIQTRYYQSPNITLEQLLASNGIQMSGSDALCLYQNGVFPQETLARTFGYSFEETLNFYEKRSRPQRPPGQFFSFDVLQEMAMEDCITWQNQLIAIAQENAQLNQKYEKMYRATLNLLSIQEAREKSDKLTVALNTPALTTVADNIYAFLKRNYPAKEKKLIPQATHLKGFYNKFLECLKIKTNVNAPSIGRVFEEATAARTIDFLKNNLDFQKIISEVWLNVKICNQDKTEIVTAEYDVLILLKNAILLHLECKTGDFTQKDLDARLLVMQESSSKLAKLFIVAPLFTQLSQSLYFAQMKKSFVTLTEQKKLKCFFLTLPNQPNTFTYQDDEEKKTVSIPTFEDSLKKILQPYLSTSV